MTQNFNNQKIKVIRNELDKYGIYLDVREFNKTINVKISSAQELDYESPDAVENMAYNKEKHFNIEDGVLHYTKEFSCNSVEELCNQIKLCSAELCDERLYDTTATTIACYSIGSDMFEASNNIEKAFENRSFINEIYRTDDENYIHIKPASRMYDGDRIYEDENIAINLYDSDGLFEIQNKTPYVNHIVISGLEKNLEIAPKDCIELQDDENKTLCNLIKHCEFKINGKQADNLIIGAELFDGKTGEQIECLPDMLDSLDDVAAYFSCGIDADIGNFESFEDFFDNKSIQNTISNNFTAYEINNALKIIDDTIYKIEDNIPPSVMDSLDITSAKKQLYVAFDKAYDVIQSSVKMTKQEKDNLIQKFNIERPEKNKPSLADKIADAKARAEAINKNGDEKDEPAKDNEER